MLRKATNLVVFVVVVFVVVVISLSVLYCPKCEMSHYCPKLNNKEDLECVGQSLTPSNAYAHYDFLDPAKFQPQIWFSKRDIKSARHLNASSLGEFIILISFASWTYIF